MIRVPGQQIERVGQQRKNGLERSGSTCGIPRNINNQGSAGTSANSAGEWGEGSLLQACGAHAFGQAIDQAIADQARGFRGDIACCQASPTSGYDQVGGGGESTQVLDNGVQIIGNSFLCHERSACAGEQAHQRGAGEVHLSSRDAAVTDR